MAPEKLNFQNLPEQQIQVLMLLAYSVRPISSDVLDAIYYKIFKQRNTNTEHIVQDLEKSGYVELGKSNNWWGRKTIKLKIEWTYDVMRLLLKDYSKYLKKYEKALDYYDPNEALRKEYCLIYQSIFNKSHENFSIEDNNTFFLARQFLYAFTTHTEVLNYLPEKIVHDMVAQYALKLINDDSENGISQLIDFLLEQTKVRQFPPYVLHLLQLGYVMQTGTRHNDIPLKGQSFIFDLVKMLEAMEKKDYETAVNEFSTAINRHVDYNLYWIRPHYFPLLNMLYGIAMYLAYRQKNSHDLERDITSVMEDRQKDYFVAMLIFAHSLNDKLEQRTVMEISALIDCAPQNAWISQKLGLMLSEWLGISSEQIVREGCDKMLCAPESKNYNAHATRLANELLQTIPTKIWWERTLNMIMENEGGGGGRLKAVENEKRTKRLAYFMVNPSYIEVREQTRLKSGRWSAGKKVPDSRFYDMNDSDMDDVDLSIQDKVKSQEYSYSLKPEDILPLLKGCRKLYYGSHAPYANCDVVEEKPFIATHVESDGITITCNLSRNSLSVSNKDRLLIEFKPGERGDKDNELYGTVVYYQVSTRLKQYLNALLSIEKFPLDAEPQLKLLFEQIKGKVEIHSEMIEGGSTLPKVDGKADIIIRIIPVNDWYEVQAVVRPLENGRQTVLPGCGDSNIYDYGEDHVRYHVVRDKVQEKKNVKTLRNYMEMADVTEKSPYVWTLAPNALLEFMEWIPEQGNDYVTEWPEGERIKLRTPDLTQWNISLKERSGWFEVEGELPIDEHTVLNIGRLLNLIGEGHSRFIKMDDGLYLRLTESLRRQLQRIDSVANSVRGKMKISTIGAGLVADYFDGDVTISHPKKIDDLHRRIRKSENLLVEIPEELNATLRDYQADGVQWINRLTSWGAGVCLADDMGLGKTLQAITFLLQKQKDGASMVVAPASVVPNWKKELDRFAPTLNVTVLNDFSSDDRKTAVKEAANGDVILTTYGLLISEEEALVEKSWNVVCLDEAHNIKNASTKTSAVCMRLQVSKRLILTGTPIQNHLGELWNLFSFINPGLLGSYEQFTKKYVNPIEGAHDKERQQQLKRIIQPFMLRRTKKEVVKELPDKQEITIPVELSKDELAVYELIRMKAKAQLEEDADGNGSASVNALAMIAKLRMASCSATLVQKKLSCASSKLSTFCDLVSEICTAGNRVLVFSQFTSFLEMAKQQLKSLNIKDYLYLDGSTPVGKRAKMVEQFQTGRSQIFLISLKAGGLGLNLTGANYVIHLDPWWNPAIEQQATDRAYRIGQKQKVTVYHLISQHTIEEKIVRLHQTKRDLADSLLDGTDMSHKLSARDLLDMLQTDIL